MNRCTEYRGKTASRKVFRRNHRLSDRFQGVWVEAEPVGVVHVVGSAKASEYEPADPPDKTVATVLSTTGVRGCVLGRRPVDVRQSTVSRVFRTRQHSADCRHDRKPAPGACMALAPIPFAACLG